MAVALRRPIGVKVVDLGSATVHLEGGIAMNNGDWGTLEYHSPETMGMTHLTSSVASV